MKADAIFQVTQALRARLQQAVSDAGLQESPVFVGPLDDEDATGAPLILFLYRIVPNASLRNREHRVPSDTPPPPVQVFANSLPLDLHYLVTTGTLKENKSEEPFLKVLGSAMLSLQLDPELTGPVVSYEAVHVSLEPLTAEELSRIWALFPTANYRTSIAYLATPVWVDPPQPVPPAARVVEDRLDAGSRVVTAVE